MEAADLVHGLVRCWCKHGKLTIDFVSAVKWQDHLSLGIYVKKDWNTELDEQQQNGDCEVFTLISAREGNKTQEAKKQQSFKRRRNQKQNCKWKQTFQLGTFDVGEGVLDPGEWLNVGDAGSMTERGLMMEPVWEKAGRKVPKDEHEPNCGTDRQVWVRVLNIHD